MVFDDVLGEISKKNYKSREKCKIEFSTMSTKGVLLWVRFEQKIIYTVCIANKLCASKHNGK